MLARVSTLGRVGDSALKNGVLTLQRALSGDGSGKPVDPLADIRRDVNLIQNDLSTIRRQQEADSEPDVTLRSLMSYSLARYAPMFCQSEEKKEKNKQDFNNEWSKWNQQSSGQKTNKFFSAFGMPGLFSVIYMTFQKHEEHNIKAEESIRKWHAIDIADGLLRDKMQNFRSGITISSGVTDKILSEVEALKETYKQSNSQLKMIVNRANADRDDICVIPPLNVDLIFKHNKFQKDTKFYQAYMAQELDRTYAVMSPYMDAYDPIYYMQKMEDMLNGKEVAVSYDGEELGKYRMLVHNEEGLNNVRYRTLDAYLAITTAENKYDKAVDMLGILYSKPDDESLPLMSVDTSPAYLLTRIGSQIMRFQAHREIFNLDENLQDCSIDEKKRVKGMSGDKLFYHTGGQAEKFLKKAIEADPEFPGSYNLLAVLNMRYMDIMKHDKTSEEYKNAKKAAYENIQAAIGLDPNNPVFLINRAKFYNRDGDYQQALVDVEHVLKDGPNQSASLVKANSLYHIAKGLPLNDKRREDLFNDARKALYPVKLEADAEYDYKLNSFDQCNKLKQTNHILGYEDYCIVAKVLKESSQQEDIDKSERLSIIARYYGQPEHNGLASAIKLTREKCQKDNLSQSSWIPSFCRYG